MSESTDSPIGQSIEKYSFHCMLNDQKFCSQIRIVPMWIFRNCGEFLFLFLRMPDNIQPTNRWFTLIFLAFVASSGSTFLCTVCHMIINCLRSFHFSLKTFYRTWFSDKKKPTFRKHSSVSGHVCARQKLYTKPESRHTKLCK